MSEHTRRFGALLVDLGLVTPAQVDQALALQPLTGSRLGEALLSLGFLTRPQLQRALSAAVARGQEVLLERPLIGEVLLGLKYITPEVLAKTLEAQQQSGRRLGELLVEQGALDHRQLYEALALQKRMGDAATSSGSGVWGEPRRDGPGHSVVLVDDSEETGARLEKGLAARGYQVTTFTDPFAALEQVDLLKPDLVLSDLEMPGLSGAELCRRLKLGPRALPVVLLTSTDDDTQRLAGLKAGADDYVEKTASLEELGARIETVLRRTQETERMRRLFARYTSDAVVSEVMRTGGLVLTGERREVTVLFADLRGFTAFAEARAPEEVMRVLNALLGGLADVVLEWGGTLDKFLGDGLMAVWGAPVSHPDDVVSALCAAQEMFETMRSLLPSVGATLQLGVGVNSGPVIAGSVGSARRTEYTCVGDTVNVASRLCALASGTEALLGEGTARALGLPDDQLKEVLQALAPVRLKGRREPVPLYKVRPALGPLLTARRLGAQGR